MAKVGDAADWLAAVRPLGRLSQWSIGGGQCDASSERERRCHLLCIQTLLDSMANANEPRLSEEVWLV